MCLKWQPDSLTIFFSALEHDQWCVMFLTRCDVNTSILFLS